MESRNPLISFWQSMYFILDGPVTFFREKIVVPNQQHYPYYHQKFQRVPNIDECYTDDAVCHFEANEQFLRDRMVDSGILSILRSRYEHCNNADINNRGEDTCEALYEYYNDAAGAYFEKYGDLGPKPDVKFAFMKQKHRMVWERRHGKVGSGMKKDEFKVEEDDMAH